MKFMHRAVIFQIWYLHTSSRMFPRILAYSFYQLRVFLIRIFIIDCDITIMYKLMCPFDPIYPTKSLCFNVSNVGLGNQLVKIFKLGIWYSFS